MMFTIVGCSFRRFIASKSGLLIVRLSPETVGREVPPLMVRLNSTN